MRCYTLLQVKESRTGPSCQAHHPFHLAERTPERGEFHLASSRPPQASSPLSGKDGGLCERSLSCFSYLHQGKCFGIQYLSRHTKFWRLLISSRNFIICAPLVKGLQRSSLTKLEPRRVCDVPTFVLRRCASWPGGP